MKRTLVLLAIAIATVLGLASPASAQSTPTIALSVQDARDHGYTPPVWQGRYDTAGRPDTHPLFGTDYGIHEDGPAFDCRTTGNRICGSASQHDAVKACVQYAQVLADVPGDPAERFLVECFAVAYDAPLADASAYVGEWQAEWTAEWNHNALAGYTYEAGIWW